MLVSFEEVKEKRPQSCCRTVLTSLEHPVVAWSILAASLLLTLGAWWVSRCMYENRLKDRFSFRVNRVVDAIEKRLLEYEQVLRGGVGLFAASENVSRDEWRTYVANCEIDRYFPGIQGMGVAVPVTPSEKQNHERSIQLEGFDNYQIHPTHQRDFYTSIVYLEPFDWRNQRAFGYDMYSNPVRREAMDRAIQTGEPAMSGMVTLVQETTTDVQRGWLYYLPIFKVNDQLGSKTSNQRSQLERFVYAAFRAKDLMSGILDARDKDVDFEIYDSNSIERSSLMFDSDRVCHLDERRNSALSKNVNLTIRGREWTLHFEARPGLLAASGENHSSLVALGGLTVDVLLFLVIAFIGRQKRMAEQLAESMVKDVKQNADLIKQILSNASEAIVTIDQQGLVKLANKSAHQIFGFQDGQSGFNFETLLTKTTWSDIADQINFSSDGRYKCSSKLQRPNGEQFFCRLNFGVCFSNKQKFYVLIARDVTERMETDRKIEEINRELLQASETAAKVELANGVLHNVGNILNSINVSATVIRKQVGTDSISKLDRLCKLINEHDAGFSDFVQNDKRGKKIPIFLEKIADSLVGEQQGIERELGDLLKNVSHVKEVIASQQSDAKSSAANQLLAPQELMTDAITVNKAVLSEHSIEVIHDGNHNLPEIWSDRNRILQILVNLIKNASDALIENKTPVPSIRASVRTDADYVVFEVTDNGVGMSADVLQKIFEHGFTTKTSGHGFGLHSCMHAAADLGGKLEAYSDGLGCGATFQLVLPVSPAKSDQQNMDQVGDGQLPIDNHEVLV